MRAGLCDAGYVEGNTFKLEARWAHGRPEMLRPFSQDLVQLRVDLVVATALSWKMLLAGWGMSEKTLARRLSDEGLNFTEIFQHLRRDLAIRYLDDRKLHVSKIAWLLGFHEVSAFTNAFKRWTGKAPSQMRTTGA